MRLAFAGTPEFARVALARLHGAGFEIALVLTPARPAGRPRHEAARRRRSRRSRSSTASRWRSRAACGSTASSPTTPPRRSAALAAAAPDVMVVAAYGLILPPWLLALPRLGCLNIHASLLPRWRGAAPIQRAIEAGDDVTGITIMQMDAGLDTGADAARRDARRSAPTTAPARCTTRLAALGGELVVRGARRRSPRPRCGRPQPETGVTYAAQDRQGRSGDRLARAGRRDRAPPARLRSVPRRAQRPRRRDDQAAGAASSAPDGGRPGEIVAGDGGALAVACGEGALALTELQRAGGRRMAGRRVPARLAPAVGAVFDAGARPGARPRPIELRAGRRIFAGDALVASNRRTPRCSTC